jgi:hypothetical protein
MPISRKHTDVQRNSNLASDNRKLLLFDLFFTGHHAGYILHLVTYWREQQLPGSLDILVTSEFMQLHPDVVNTAFESSQSKIKFMAISLEEEAVLKSEDSSLNRIVRSFQEWSLLQKYVRKLKPTQCLLMYFDSILLSLALKGRLPCPLSGIYFRPIFHYGDFADFKSSQHERFLQMRDKFVLSRILQKSHSQTLFCLDPFAVEHISKLNSRIKAIYLPDPVQRYSEVDSLVEKLIENLGIHPQRKIF